MAHPLMFDDDDPLLRRLRTLALALPEAAEKITYGRPALDLADDTDWTEVAELLDASYRMTAPRRLVSLLDSV